MVSDDNLVEQQQQRKKDERKDREMIKMGGKEERVRE